ncbi:MAG: CapA family protein, partial [Patescibacteria group bacterium]
KAATALKDAGFDILSVANNHIGDWGEVAMTDTFARLKNAGIVSVGGGTNAKDAHDPKILEVRGTKIAYLAYSQFGKGYTEAGGSTPGIAIIDKDSIMRDVSYAKSVADIIVVSFHFGDEYNDMPNEFQKQISHLAIDAGADLAVGHHPHVIEPIEEYKGKTIAYSLGNFVFDQAFSSKTRTGIMLSVSLKGKSIERVSTTTIFINSNFQPQLAK